MADDTDDRDYEVGYGKPPKRTQFKKGRSGNPKGKPKGRKNFKTEFLEELSEQIAVREGGTRRIISKQRALLKSLIAKAVQGDPKAATLIANMVFRLLHQNDDPVEDQDLSPDDLAIVKDYVKRNQATPKPRKRTRPKKGN